MPVKVSRKDSTSHTTSPSRGRGRIYSERWDLSHLAKDPVQRFEALVGEIESKVARFEVCASPTQSDHGNFNLSPAADAQ